jgi:hypothetical protein
MTEPEGGPAPLAPESTLDPLLPLVENLKWVTPRRPANHRYNAGTAGVMQKLAPVSKIL